MVSPSSKPRLAAVSSPLTRRPSNANRTSWRQIALKEAKLFVNLHVESVPLAVSGHEILQCSCSLYLELSCVSRPVYHLNKIGDWVGKKTQKEIVFCQTPLGLCIYLQVEVFIRILNLPLLGHWLVEAQVAFIIEFVGIL